MQQLQRTSLEMMPDYCHDLHERTGLDPEYRRCGSIELLFGDQRYRMAVSEERAGAKRGMVMPDGQPEWQMLTPDQAREIEPCVTGDCLGALLNRFTAQVRNPRLLQALIAACRADGVDLREHTAVGGLIVKGDRVTGVVTADGPVEADRVVVCAGAWSSGLDPRLDELMPTHPVRGQVVLLDASAGQRARFSHIVDRKGCYLVPRSDGLVLIGATVEDGPGFDRRNTPEGVGKLIRDALSLIPSLGEAGVVALWAGLRPGTPDRRPYIGPVPGLDRLLAATGPYRTGLALAPITAEIAGDLVIRGATNRDLSLCRPGRST